jgi:hypothetical protein
LHNLNSNPYNIPSSNLFFYGGYEHPAGEVYPTKLEIIPHFSEVGVKWGSTFAMEVSGNFLDVNPELDPAGVNARISAMESAYKFDYRDCGFKFNDGSLTEHYLLTDDAFNLSGNKVVWRSWDNMTPTEFANTRSFSIRIQAKFETNYNNVLEFRETLQQIGTGDEVWRLYNNFAGEPVKEVIFNQSKVLHVQKGYVVGMKGYIAIPDPIWPEEEQQWRRVNVKSTPRHHGHLSFDRETHYRTDYAYFFERIGADPLPVPSPWHGGT